MFDRIDVEFRRIGEEGLSFIYPFIEQWKCTTFENENTLFRTGEKCPRILKDITNIHFPFLTYLRFDFNNIESVEMLPRIWMPNIAEMNINSSIFIKAAIKSAEPGA